MGLSQWKSRLSIARILLFSLSVVSLVIGAGGATAHYLRWSWGNRAHPIGWLLSLFFLLLAFLPSPHGMTTPFQVPNKAEDSILSLLDFVFCNLASLEFPHCAMERGRPFLMSPVGISGT
jgi:hypothetical protein